MHGKIIEEMKLLDGTDKENELIYQYSIMALEGDSEAQCIIGDWYYYASKRNIYTHHSDADSARWADQAIYWYEKSAAQGDMQAQYRLGQCYENGFRRGTKNDLKRAFEIYKIAAENGNPFAQECLGDCYRLGSVYGIRANVQLSINWYAKAIQTYTKAVEDVLHADPIMMERLSQLYEKGRGTLIDKSQSHKWFEKAVLTTHLLYSQNPAHYPEYMYLYIRAYKVDDTLFSYDDDARHCKYQCDCWYVRVAGKLDKKFREAAAAPKNNFEIEYGCLRKYTPAPGETSITIPEGVTSIEKEVFKDCNRLKSVSLPQSLEEIEGSAFEGCSKLKTISFPKNLKSISGHAFYKCISLTEISLPGVEIIYGNAFNSCFALKKVIFSENLKAIGIFAFCNCTALTEITLPVGLIHMHSSAFDWFTVKKVTCTAAQEKMIQNYCPSQNNLKITFKIVKAPSGRDLLEIKKGVLLKYRQVAGETSVTIPEGVTRIESRVFNHCDFLKEVTFPSSLREIGEGAFNNCSGLKKLILPEGLREIGGGAFNCCSGLEELILPEGLTKIEDFAFSTCRGLHSITLPQSLKALPEDTFDMCTYVKTIWYPENLEDAVHKAFSRCKDITFKPVKTQQTTVTPEKSTEPEVSKDPEVSKEPEVTKEQEVSKEEEVSKEPEVKIALKGTEKPEEKKKVEVIAPSKKIDETKTKPAKKQKKTEKDVKSVTKTTKTKAAPIEKTVESVKSIENTHDDNFKVIQFGSYMQGERGGGKPIEWIVLKEENGCQLVISKYLLAGRAYDEKKKSVTWAECDLHSWLNSDAKSGLFHEAGFIHMAFTPKERKRINPVVIQTKDSKRKQLTDKVFLLSEEEVKEYFPDNTARACSPTAYAKKQGVKNSWWLRSPANKQGYVTIVLDDGSIQKDNSNINDSMIAIRPAMWITL